MPPQRTIPPAKAVKTERTHEENQERAYIAASRRSDRSLEARVESARRASEIHKRRTGRSLRVTEQDVVNEEMYEEEDDDLPMQYRRLTAHLQTGSADFNRRLSAYLTNHVAMRSALDQAVQNSYAQQYPNAPQFARSQSLYQSPMIAHQAQQIMYQNLQQQNMQVPTNPAIYGQYDNQQAGFRPPIHGRSASIAVPREATPSLNPASPTMLHETGRRMSMPATIKTDIPDSAAVAHPMSATIPQARPPFPQNNSLLPPSFLPQYNMDIFTGGPYASSPFSMALPPESQLLLGSNLNDNDPLTAMFMAGAEQFGLTNCPYNPSLSQNSTNKVSEQTTYPSYTGLNSTLAGGINPSQLDLNSGVDYLNPSVLEMGNASTNATGVKVPSGQGSAAGTPGLNGDNWDQYIDEGQWDIPTSSQ